MPYRITKKNVSDIYAEVLVAPIDSNLSTAYRYGLDQKRVDDFRRFYTKLDQGDIVVMHQDGQRYGHVIFVVQSEKEDSVKRLTYCYQDILDRAAANEWRSIALPVFSLSTKSPLPSEDQYRIAMGEIKRILRRSKIDVFLSVGQDQKIPVKDSLLDKLSSYIEQKLEKKGYEELLQSLGHDNRYCVLGYDPQGSASPFEDLAEADDFLPSADKEKPSPPPTFANKDIQKERSKVSRSQREARRARESDYIWEESYKLFRRDSEAPNAFFDPQSKTIKTEESFSEALIKLIDERGLTDPECYNRANISRAVFNKIKQSAIDPKNRSYRPSKTTALAFALALKLSLDETNDLLKKAGLALSHSDEGDIIIEYCLLNHMYDIYEVNELLFRFDQPLLGSF